MIELSKQIKQKQANKITIKKKKGVRGLQRSEGSRGRDQSASPTLFLGGLNT